MARIDSFFKFMKEQSASDLHLSTGNPPMLRIHGELVRVDTPPLGNDDLKSLVSSREVDSCNIRYLRKFCRSVVWRKLAHCQRSLQLSANKN